MRASETIRRLRLWTGLVLVAYLTTHFANHALGLVSLDALERGRDWFLLLWRNPLGTLLLYGALVTHLGLALWSLYQRRSLRMPAWEASQLGLGLAIPPLLILHVLGTRLAHEVFDTGDSYAYVVLVIWVFNPVSGLRQVATLLIAWLHGCIGLHFWLRLRPWYRRAVPYLFAAALLLPVLALLGFATAGRELARLAQDPEWLAAARAEIGFPAAADTAWLYRLERSFIVGYAVLVAGTLAARAVRHRLDRRRAVTIAYPDGRRVAVRPGTTVLEASRGAGIPHASVCGGRGRCSTCRVRIVVGLDGLAPPSADERRVLDRVGAGLDVRLACQSRPTAEIAVVPLLAPSAGPRDAAPRPGYLQGHDEEIAILFADLRGFSGIAEHRLPYDLVFLLNRYFRAMGMAVEQAGGHLDKFIGDGVMALFRVGGRPDEGCRQALAAAQAMAANLDELNRALAHELDAPLRLGIGINFGHAVVGEMGYGRAAAVTAIGDAVNAASRLEALTKRYDCLIVMAEEVARRAGLDPDRFERHDVAVRGREQVMALRVVRDASELPADLPPPAAPRGRRMNRGYAPPTA